MTGIPWHPLVVHFPIVFSVLLPLAALTAVLLGFRTGTPRRYWPAVLVLHALLLASAYVAVRTGEKEEDKVEMALASEDPLESHEEKAELFLKVAGAALAASALGMAPGALGLAGRAMAGAGALAVLLLGIQVGHSGGALVYQHGAGAAYAGEAPDARGSGASAAGPSQANHDEPGRDRDHD